MSDNQPVPARVPVLGIMAVLSGAGMCVYGLVFIHSAATVDLPGGGELYGQLAPMFPLVLITALALCVAAGAAKSHLLGVLGGVLCLIPLLRLLLGGAF